MVAARRKIDARGWSPSGELLGGAAPILGKELSPGLSDQKENLIDLTGAGMDPDKRNIDAAAESV